MREMSRSGARGCGVVTGAMTKEKGDKRPRERKRKWSRVRYATLLLFWGGGEFMARSGEGEERGIARGKRRQNKIR